MLISTRRNTRLIQTPVLAAMNWSDVPHAISGQFKTLSIIDQRFLGPFFMRDKEDLLKEIYIKMARCKSIVQGE